MKTIESTLLSSCKNLLHAYSTRTGGYSVLGNNLAYHVGDLKEDTDKNQNELALRLGYSFERLVHMNQIHGDSITVIENCKTRYEVPTCDALITQEKNRPLMVMVADCIPVLIYDPIQEVIAAIHAGRAGVFSEIIPKSIARMQKRYGSNPKDILVHLGPSIHQCCYEVGAEIKEEAQRAGYTYAIKIDNDRYFLDLLAITDRQLKDSGIEEEHIERSDQCTACNTDIFYSYRAEKNKCGRFAGIIMLKQSEE
jgi:YfiH family protein